MAAAIDILNPAYRVSFEDEVHSALSFRLPSSSCSSCGDTEPKDCHLAVHPRMRLAVDAGAHRRAQGIPGSCRVIALGASRPSSPWSPHCASACTPSTALPVTAAPSSQWVRPRQVGGQRPPTSCQAIASSGAAGQGRSRAQHGRAPAPALTGRTRAGRKSPLLHLTVSHLRDKGAVEIKTLVVVPAILTEFERLDAPGSRGALVPGGVTHAQRCAASPCPPQVQPTEETMPRQFDRPHRRAGLTRRRLLGPPVPWPPRRSRRPYAGRSRTGSSVLRPTRSRSASPRAIRLPRFRALDPPRA